MSVPNENVWEGYNGEDEESDGADAPEEVVEAAEENPPDPAELQRQLAETRAALEEERQGKKQVLDTHAATLREMHERARAAGLVYDRETGTYGVADPEKAQALLGGGRPAAQAPEDDEEIELSPFEETFGANLKKTLQREREATRAMLESYLGPVLATVAQQAQPTIQSAAREALDDLGFGHVAETPEFRAQFEENLGRVALGSRSDPAVIAQVAGMSLMALPKELRQRAAPETPAAPAARPNPNGVARNGMRATAPSRDAGGARDTGPTDDDRRASEFIGQHLGRRVGVTPDLMASLRDDDYGTAYRRAARERIAKEGR